MAVDGIALDVQEGEIFGLLGPNGAGKTSALSAIEGLVRPDAGSIMVGDVDARVDPLGARAQMGVQLQSTSFHADLTILEILRLYAGLYGLKVSESQLRHRLAEIDLQDDGSKRFRELSGGQQQRLSLLISTIHDPPWPFSTSPRLGSTHSHAVSFGIASRVFARRGTVSSSPRTRWRKRRPCVIVSRANVNPKGDQNDGRK
ncbi:MAG: ATP-binding cassette domain-containing protein, partial [Candidatus Dormibacteria bacterium]